MRGFQSVALMAMLALICVGCGSPTTAPTSVSVTPVTNTLKASLEGLAKTGELGSGSMEFQEQYDKLKASDSAKAEAIAADFEKLMKGGSKDAVKKLATAIAAKL